MPASDLWQFQLGDLAFGDGSPITNTGFSYSEPAAATADLAMAGEDGIQMGRDYLQGRTLSWDLTIDREAAGDARDLWQALESAWDARDIRLMPSAVTPVRIQAPDGLPVLAYGRPRKLAPVEMRFLRAGRVDITADFSTVDRLFYDATEQEVSFGIQPTIGVGGGITWPVTWPTVWASADTSNVDVVVNGGTAPTWPVITFEGPVVDPKVVFGDGAVYLQLIGLVLSNQSVTVDTRPWVRSVLRSDGGSLAGAIRGSRLADLLLAPGTTAVAIEGIDLDGTASARIRWRNAYTTP